MRSYGRFAIDAIFTTLPLVGASRAALATVNLTAVGASIKMGLEAYAKFKVVLRHLSKAQAANRDYARAYRKAHTALDQMDHLLDHLKFIEERMKINSC